jgi:hypothetical protein
VEEDCAFEASVKLHQEQLIKAAATLYGVQKMQGDAVRAKTHEAYGRILDAHMLISGVLGAALLRENGKVVPMNPQYDQRTALCASFIIGMSICEDAIAEGRYIQAQALLRQEMETLAQLKAVRAGKRRLNGSPNISSLGKSLSRMYGSLSAVTHLSRHDLISFATHWVDADLSDVPHDTKATRQFPSFDYDAARRSFSLHVFLMMQLIDEMSVNCDGMQGTVFTASECDAVGLAVDLLALEGMVERLEDV